jgi:hypothetical protein
VACVPLRLYASFRHGLRCLFRLARDLRRINRGVRLHAHTARTSPTGYSVFASRLNEIVQLFQVLGKQLVQLLLRVREKPSAKCDAEDAKNGFSSDLCV